MKITPTRLYAAMLVLGMVVGCSQPNAPVAEGDAAPSIEPTDVVDAASSASGAVALTEYDASAVPAAGGNCALDAIDGGPVADATAKAGAETMFGGWIADAANQVPSEARLILKGTGKSYSAPLVAGAERLDVAASLQADSLKLSGYNVIAKLDVVPGAYDLSIVHGPVGAEASCSLNNSLLITN